MNRTQSPPRGGESEAQQPIHTRVYRIDAMDCPTEEALIRNKFNKVQGITSLDFNLIDRELTITHTREVSTDLEQSIRSLGFEPQLVSGNQVRDLTETSSNTSPKHTLHRWLPYGLALLIALAAEFVQNLTFNLPRVDVSGQWLAAVFALIAIGITGMSTYKKGWISIINRQLNMNALMSIAVTGACFLQYWSEAAMVMVLFSLSERIEELSITRAGDAIRELLDLSPERALLRQVDGQWKETLVQNIEPGAIIKVLSGERVPLDGIITLGTSWVDQSPLTGESVPLEKRPGDSVFAGTINLDGVLEIQITKGSEQTELAKIIRIMKQAQANKAPTQRFVDAFAAYYTPLVVIAALVTAVFPTLVLGLSWSVWVYRSLVLLIIACPCALVISTPVTVVSGLTRAAGKGIIIKGGVYLENAGRISYLAVDKTGTLTKGTPTIQRVRTFTENLDQFYTAVALLGSQSTHPLSRAASSFAQTKIDHNDTKPITNLEVLPGRGIAGVLGNSRWLLGSKRFLEDQSVVLPSENSPFRDVLVFDHQNAEDAQALVYVAQDTQVVGLFFATDPLKDSSVQAIQELKSLGITPVLLSGDLPRTVKQVGLAAGIEQSYGGLLPQDKVTHIQDLQEKGSQGSTQRNNQPWVAMAGDGINDGPSLVQSDLGIAMGSLGTGVAVESASVVLMDDDLGKIPFLIRLSRKTRQVLTQNIVLALGIKGVFFALTLLGYGSMWMAVFADMGASLIVVFLGMRLLNFGKRVDSKKVEGRILP